jgi:hypothetical protein
MPRCGPVVGCEFKRCGVTPPAGQRLPEAFGMPGVHPHKGRCARPTVQVFVAAADGEIGIGTVQVHRHGAGAVGQVPHRQCARSMRGGGHGGHVVHGAGAVVHVGEHQHGNIRRQRGMDLVRLDQLQAQSALLAQSFSNVQVSREVAALAHDQLAMRRVLRGDVQRRAEHLVQVDGGAVGGHHFAWFRTDKLRDLVAQHLRQLEPARGVPAADQAVAPFLRHGGGHARRRSLGHHAQRIAVQVDHVGRNGEQIAQRAQGVLRVKCAAVVQGGHRLLRIAPDGGSSRRIARTGDASAVISFRGRAMSS